MNEQATVDASRDRNRADEQSPRAVDWEDPSIPVGDAPALPRWLLYLLAVAWAGWIIFLLVIAVAGRAPSA